MRRSVSDTGGQRNAIAASLVVALTASGCSFVFSEGAPDDHRRRATFDCGESWAPPIVDSIATGLYAVTSVSQASSRSTMIARTIPADRDTERRNIDVTIGVSAALATLEAASAIYGYTATASCRAALRQYDADVARARVLPKPYGVPPFGAPPPLWPPPPVPATPSP